MTRPTFPLLLVSAPDIGEFEPALSKFLTKHSREGSAGLRTTQCGEYIDRYFKGLGNERFFLTEIADRGHDFTYKMKQVPFLKSFLSRYPNLVAKLEIEDFDFSDFRSKPPQTMAARLYPTGQEDKQVSAQIQKSSDDGYLLCTNYRIKMSDPQGPQLIFEPTEYSDKS